MQDHQAFNKRLARFLDASPTPFHAVSEMSRRLADTGFIALEEGGVWNLKPGGKYFVSRNGSSLIAFVMGANDIAQSGIRMVGAHTDSPCLMIKPQPEISNKGYFQLGVEVYGGALLNPWFDRDLSIAGRIVFNDESGSLRQKLVNFDQPVALIPSLAIHLDREANKNRSINAQKDIPPILMQSHGKENFRDMLAVHFCPGGSKVLDYELCLYDVQGAATLGMNQEFFASARLDNLLSCFVGMQALMEADGENTSLLVCNDHEEVGSVSAIGADGPFLESVVNRICDGATNKALDRSLLISCDNAHAVHPNFSDRHDVNHMPALNGGPVIKVNVKQRYATTGVTASIFRQLCVEHDVPVQTFVSRSDLECGSTIGPITSARLGVPTLDVGLPQLAMHSCREVTGVKDPVRLATVLQAFLNRPGNIAVEFE